MEAASTVLVENRPFSPLVLFDSRTRQASPTFPAVHPEQGGPWRDTSHRTRRSWHRLQAILLRGFLTFPLLLCISY